jgi:hypothetical protein
MSRTGAIEGRVIGTSSGRPVRSFTLSTEPAPEDRGDRGGFGRGGQDRGRGMGPPDMGRNTSSDPARALMDAMGRIMRQPAGPTAALTEKEEDFRNDNGYFKLDTIVPGSYRLCVSANGYAPVLSAAIIVEAGEVVRDVAIDLGPGASISGKAQSPFGPVEEARIRIQVDSNLPDGSRLDRDQERDLRLLLDTLDECETDEGGNFTIDNLPAGRFILRATHPDHPDKSTDPIELSEGQAVTGVLVDFPPAARIVGIALDEMGAPLADQTVSCQSRGDGGRGGGRGVFRRERTDGEGRFEFGELRAGEYQVSISERGRGFGRRGGGPDEGAVDVELLAGGFAEIVLQKKAPEGAVVEGVVMDDSGPVGNGFITVTLQGSRDRNASRSGMINEDGSYRIEGVSPGTNSFSIRFMTGDSFESTIVEYEIPDLQVFHLDIPLPGGRISGIVLDEITRAPLEGVRVALTAEGETQQQGRGGRGRGGRWSGRRVTTGKDGTFQFRFLAAGIYDLEANPTGELSTRDGLRYYAAEVSDLPLVDGQARENIEMLLGPAGTIEVTVVDENNLPFQGAQITARLEGGAQAGGVPGVRGRTNDEGVAVIDEVKPGVYTLNIQARQMSQQAVGGVSVSSGQYAREFVTITAGFQISVRLQTSDGEPVAEANITLRNAQGVRLNIGGRGGRGGSSTYQLGNLSAGQYTIDAEWNGNKGSGGFGVSAAGTITVTLK